MNVNLLRSAKIDLREGYLFYESGTEGLGLYFLESLMSDIESLRIYAGIHYKINKDYYRLLSKRFPFAVYYKIFNNEADVYAVVDCRRDPIWIDSKLNQD